MSNVPALLMQSLTAIIEALSKTIAINHRMVMNEITSKLPLNNGQENPIHIEVMDEEMADESEADASTRRLKEELPSELEQETKLVGYLLSAQRISAEVLSNICTPYDEMNVDVDDKSDAESVQDYDVSQQNGNRLSADKIPLEVSESIKAHQIVEKVSLTNLIHLYPHGVSSLIFFNGRGTRYTCGIINHSDALTSWNFRPNCFSSGMFQEGNRINDP